MKIILIMLALVSYTKAMEVSKDVHALDKVEILTGRSVGLSEGWDIVGDEAYYKITKRIIENGVATDSVVISNSLYLTNSEFKRFKKKIVNGKLDGISVSYEYWWCEDEPFVNRAYKKAQNKYPRYSFDKPNYFIRFKMSMDEYRKIVKEYQDKQNEKLLQYFENQSR